MRNFNLVHLNEHKNLWNHWYNTDIKFLHHDIVSFSQYLLYAYPNQYILNEGVLTDSDTGLAAKDLILLGLRIPLYIPNLENQLFIECFTIEQWEKSVPNETTNCVVVFDPGTYDVIFYRREGDNWKKNAGFMGAFYDTRRLGYKVGIKNIDVHGYCWWNETFDAIATVSSSNSSVTLLDNNFRQVIKDSLYFIIYGSTTIAVLTSHQNNLESMLSATEKSIYIRSPLTNQQISIVHNNTETVPSFYKNPIDSEFKKIDWNNILIKSSKTNRVLWNTSAQQLTVFPTGHTVINISEYTNTSEITSLEHKDFFWIPSSTNGRYKLFFEQGQLVARYQKNNATSDVLDLNINNSRYILMNDLYKNWKWIGMTGVSILSALYQNEFVSEYSQLNIGNKHLVAWDGVQPLSGEIKHVVTTNDNTDTRKQMIEQIEPFYSDFLYSVNQTKIENHAVANYTIIDQSFQTKESTGYLTTNPNSEIALKLEIY